MAPDHLPTRKSTSPSTAPPRSHPPPPTRLTQPWVSSRPSPLLWPQAPTPALTSTKSPPTPPSPHTPPKIANERAAAAAGAKAATPSLTPVPCLHPPPPPKNTPLPQSRPCSTVEFLKRSHWRCGRRTGSRWSSSCRRRKRTARGFHIRRTLRKEPWRKRRIKSECSWQSRQRRKRSRLESLCRSWGKRWRWKVCSFSQ